jgi:hypothetical protein
MASEPVWIMKAALGNQIGIYLDLPDGDLRAWHHAIEKSETMFSLLPDDAEKLVRGLVAAYVGRKSYWLYTATVDLDAACRLDSEYPVEGAYHFRYGEIC